jgi:endothelin-converting enzyme (EC 3.4.24.71). Metallo peptidase. MEROPS family M13
VKNFIALAGVLVALAGCNAQAPTSKAPSAAAKGSTAPLVSGIDQQYIDPQIKPQQDFYRHVNGRWLAHAVIPSDQSSWGAFPKLAEDTQKQLHTLVETAVKNPGDSDDARKVAAFYASFMDEKAVDALGSKPLQPWLARIDALHDKAQIPALLLALQKIGVDTPFVPYVHQDAKDSKRYIVDFAQGGIGLPDRDYYLKKDFAKIRDQYRAHVVRMLDLAGFKGADEAAPVIGLETALAKAQWTRVENRDAVKTYNPMPATQLAGLAPNFDWRAYLHDAGVHDVPYIVISEPSYLQAFSKILDQTPLATWRDYFRWQLISAYAPFLSQPFVDEHFAFYGKTLSGTPQLRVRWKRAISAINDNIGFALGKLYVAKYFPPANKARMQKLVGNLLVAYRAAFERVRWMDEPTRKRALEKLSKFTPKIGYPDHWRDYSALTIRKDDLVGNVMRASTFEFERQMHKLGKPVNRNEWEMTPQTVNAYYNPEKNEIVFPAAILQPPFFNVQADEAVNYGGIGAVIGHEISHGFDDQGSKYDGDGNLDNWWSAETRKRFDAKTHALIAEYDAFEPLPGHHVNGALTIGENIADNAGLAIAWQAYQLSLHDQPAPAMDGYSGAQRFFLGWAQVWRYKARKPLILQRLTVDPHSPPRFRVDGTVVNMDAFYRAFDVKPGDAMYRTPAQRVTLY